MPQHPVKRKLEQAILPYMLSAERLRLRPVYLTYGVYSYIHEFLIAIVALGLAPPLLSFFTVDSVNADSQKTVASALDALKKAPAWLAVATVIALMCWIFLKLLINRENVAKRAVLAHSCRKEIRQLYLKLREELQKGDPMPGLLEIQKNITELVDRHVREESWPWDGPAENIESRLQARLDRICQQFEQNWQPVPDVDQR
jgi:hypothetical protein